MRSPHHSVAEQRRSLRITLVSQALLLCSLVISLVLRTADGEWLPWGLLILVVLITLLCSMALGAYRLRRLGPSEGRHVDHQAD